MNIAVRAEVERHRALRHLLDVFDEDDGPLTAEDEVEVERYRRLLGG